MLRVNAETKNAAHCALFAAATAATLVRAAAQYSQYLSARCKRAQALAQLLTRGASECRRCQGARRGAAQRTAAQTGPGCAGRQGKHARANRTCRETARRIRSGAQSGNPITQLRPAAQRADASGAARPPPLGTRLPPSTCVPARGASRCACGLALENSQCVPSESRASRRVCALRSTRTATRRAHAQALHAPARPAASAASHADRGHDRMRHVPPEDLRTAGACCDGHAAGGAAAAGAHG